MVKDRQPAAIEAAPTCSTGEMPQERAALLFMLEDLDRSRRQVEQAHQEWVAALDVVSDLIFLHDNEFRILRCNQAYQQRAVIPFEKIIGQPYYAVFPKSDSPLPCCLRAMEKAEMGEEEVAVGGAIYRSRAFSVKDELGIYLYSVHTLEDITEHKRMAAAIIGSETRFRNLVETTSDWIWEVDENIVYTYASPKILDILGYQAAEIIGKTPFDLMHPDEAMRVAELFGTIAAARKSFTNFENTNLHKDGHRVVLETSGVPVIDPQGKFCGYRGMDRDITERKKAEETLKKNEVLLSEMGRMAKIGGWEFYPQTGQGTWTEEVARIHDMDMEVETSLEAGLGFYQGESRQKIEAAVRAAIADGTPYDLELEMVTTKGNHKWVRTIAQPVKEGGKVVKVGGSLQDITGRKQAEAKIEHANRALATLSAVNRTLVHAASEDELLQAVCQAIVEQRGYRLAWVGYVQHDERKSIKIMARAGHDEGYLDAIQLTWAEAEYGMGPSGCAIRSSATQLCQDIANDPRYLPWHEAARQRDYAASIALPLTDRNANKVFGILNVYAEEANAFTPNEIDLLEEMAGDLAFGVSAQYTRLERDLALEQSRQHLEKLRNSLENTVRAIATIVEMRDPYTAGHQVRVADLAAAIAKQIGLSDEQVHAIHLAGVVHDLGKIKIPAEILSKPGRITDIEFSLIKIHSQAGYDILKGIDFPWPIAQMVLQHHERLDGSGYPQGLKGDAIMLEARILTVADVVEAMYSHRPYRAGLGIETALAEITKQRGIYFDPAVVDACLAVFREQHYNFKS